MICTLSIMTHADIINRWPSLGEFAADLSIAYGTAKAMRRRGSIPSEYWPGVVQSAARRGIAGVSLERLVSVKSHPVPTTEVAAP